ncbi:MULTISPECIES: hypothetical protein [Kitasatospora]|uniref:Roadblock/LAMTOR2 domain-containing protein n=1 Tax=Kitasatospora cystarginea TaxID=58350 RepID=A0ABN3ELG3_9ACTN
MSRKTGAGVQARVGALLEGLVESGAESGLQVAAHLDGELIVDACADAAVNGTDRMLLGRCAKGLGYFLGLPEMAGELAAFGHHGSGGSIAFADRERGPAFALTRTRTRLVGGAANTTARLLADGIRSQLP